MIDPSSLISALMAAGRVDEAEAACRHALKGQPKSAGLLFALGQILFHARRPKDAARALEKAITVRPTFGEAHFLLGAVHEGAGDLEKAAKSYRRAAKLHPAMQVWFNLGNVLRRLGQQRESIDCYAEAHRLAPDDAKVLSALVARKQALCDWDGLDVFEARLIELVRSGATVEPFRLLALDCPDEVLSGCARRWAARFKRGGRRLPVAGGKAKLTIGYLSADFHRHATAFLAAELFELHDRSRFRIIAYSAGPNDGSEIRRRLEAGFDVFRDMVGKSTAAFTEQIVADEVDILVDLKGYTRDARTDVMAVRPAPIQVSYLGYPGTMGADFMDYIVADPVVLPMDRQPYYSERIVHLPHSYQINDRQRVRPAGPTRQSLGLPDDAVICASFNATYKISPRMFSLWTEIMAAEPKAVLWLLTEDPETDRRLSDAALARGITPDRLIFACRVPLADHLARYAVADLFLDTVPYNAHTTASDALWMGCPVVTFKKEGFPSRVAASLLHAVGLPQLVAESAEDYVALAKRLIADSARRTALRQHLDAVRLTAALFDSPQFTRDLEAVFEKMWDVACRGDLPEAFSQGYSTTETLG